MSSPKHPYVYMKESAINPRLVCEFCEKPFIEPAVADDGRHGCRACLEGTVKSYKLINEFLILEMLNTIPVKCTKCGMEDLARGKLKEHEQEACRRANVRCPAADIKCPWNGPRESLEEHKKECVYTPIRPALLEIIKENQQLKDRLQKLEKLVNELKNQK